MKHIVFSIYDQASQAYLRPMFVTAPGQAIRAFVDEVNKKDSPLNKYPDQYTLFEIGEFEDTKAKLQACTPISYGNGKQYITEHMIDKLAVEDRLRNIETSLAMLGKDVRAIKVQPLAGGDYDSGKS